MHCEYGLVLFCCRDLYVNRKAAQHGSESSALFTQTSKCNKNIFCLLKLINNRDLNIDQNHDYHFGHNCAALAQNILVI